MVGFETPLALAVIPVAGVALYYLMVMDATGSKRRRYALFASRLVVVSLLVVAFAQPFVVQTTTEQGDERVQILIDDSDSMAVFEDIADDVAAGVEQEGIAVDTTRIAEGDGSPIGDAVVSNLERDGNVLLISDGRVTEGRSLEGAAGSASVLNARISMVDLQATETERYVRLDGPEKASEDVEETFEVCVGGINIRETTSDVTVDVGGETVFSGEMTPGCEEFEHTFESTGDYRMSATVGGESYFERNNEFYKTVRVVDRPKVLYVGSNQYPLLELLEQLYEVDTADEVPSNLGADDYYGVVLQNMHADDVGDTGALQDFVIDGNGLFVAGGPNAYEHGNYDGSSLGHMLPVEEGETDEIAEVVIVLDLSANTAGEAVVEDGERYEFRSGIFGDVVKQTAIDVVDSLDDGNQVGLVGAGRNSVTLEPLGDLSTNRDELKDTIARVEPGVDVSISIDMADGLEQAGQELDGAGEVIVISDGLIYDRPPERGVLDPDARQVASRLNRQGIRVNTVGVSDDMMTDHVVMQDLAEAGGGEYYRRGSTDRISVLFGTPDSDTLNIMNSNHFITRGVDETTTDLGETNSVTVKSTGRFLVATGDGDVAMASGRYGLGRVVSVTAHEGDGTLGGLLSDPDSLLLSRGVNWAIGDPERHTTDVYDVSDTRVGEPTEVSYRGPSEPDSDAEFSRTGDDEYTAVVTPSEPGFETVGETEYAVNYAREYGAFGMSTALMRAVERTGGSIYQPSDTAGIAEGVRSHASEPRQEQNGVEWIPLVLALLIYLSEVCLRRLHDVYGYSFGSIVPSRT